MCDNWTPGLHLREVRGGCRLSLEGFAWGEGHTLQDAADDLIRRLLTVAMCLRSGGRIACSSDAPPSDIRWLEFLYEIGELAARGVDIRDRVFAAGRLETPSP